MIVVPFEPAHIARLNLQPAQVAAFAYVDAAYLERLRVSGPALTGMIGDRILGCAGVGYGLFNTGFLWTFVAGDAGRHFVTIHRAVKRFLATIDVRRLEATTDFTQGCRWLEMLGFENEGLMRAFGPDGSDHWRYARLA